MFGYVPTRAITVPWSLNHKAHKKKFISSLKVTDTELAARLHVDTNPLRSEFDPGLYGQYLFDVASCTFYNFTMDVWLSGLDTGETQVHPYTGVPQKGAGETCPHFKIEDFQATSSEWKTLNDYRRQCPYCCKSRKRDRAGRVKV